MAAQTGVHRKSKARRKFARSLVKCGKCCHTARTHFSLRRHVARYHRPSNTQKSSKFGKHSPFNRSKKGCHSIRRKIVVSTRDVKPMSSSFIVGSLDAVRKDNPEPPAVDTSVGTALGTESSQNVQRPRKVSTRIPKVLETPTRTSGRTLRSSRKTAGCCEPEVDAKNPKSRRKSSKSKIESSQSEIKSSKSKSEVLTVKRETFKSESESSESESLASKSKRKISSVKSKSLKSETETFKSKRGPRRKKKRDKRGMIPLPCHLCEYVGRDSYNLRRHMQSKHEPKPPKVRKIYHCEQCEYKNVYRFLVKRHSAIHFRKGEKSSGFACDKCDYVSASACNLKRHQACRHEKLKEAKLQCSLCDHREPDRPALFGHFREAHGVIIETERLEFDDFQSFMDFKTDTEKATLARFVRQQTRTGERKQVIFKCHRDGIFKSKSRGERKRALKTTGSNKINSACPASMRITIDPTGKVSVVFTKTHVGHSNEVCRLTLTKEERILIAEMLESKRTFQEILCEIRNGMDSDRLERIHLLSRKDLQNIERWYRTRYVEEPTRISISIDIDEWVGNVRETGVVRLYKKRATTLPKPFKCLEYGDFVLILANDFQLAMLRRYGNDCICIDNAFENSQVKLTSLMVLDDSRQGFPCAFMLSSKIDKVIMKVFLEVVRKESGCPVTPSILISGVPDSRRTEWSAVMDLPESTEVLYSPWSVEEDLNRNLVKVKKETERSAVYNVVKNLICEESFSDIPSSLAKTVKFLEEDPSTELFGKYFKSRFADTAHKWSLGYRNPMLAESRASLERTHDILKFFYSEGLKNENLEDCINVLMTCGRDHLQERIVLHLGFDPEKSEESRNEVQKLVDSIAKRHEDADAMKTQPADPGVYEIMENNLQCRCGLRCLKCDVCIHTFRCSCYDSILGWTVCRHIHFCVMSSSAEQETPVTPTASHFDPVEEKQKILLEFENMCDDIAADETTVVGVPVIVEYEREDGELEHHEHGQQEQTTQSRPFLQQQQLEDEKQQQQEQQQQQQLVVEEEQKQQQPHPLSLPPEELEDAKSKLQWRFQSICQQMSSDVDLTVIEQALASIENAIASKQTSIPE